MIISLIESKFWVFRSLCRQLQIIPPIGWKFDVCCNGMPMCRSRSSRPTWYCWDIEQIPTFTNIFPIFWPKHARDPFPNDKFGISTMLLPAKFSLLKRAGSNSCISGKNDHLNEDQTLVWWFLYAFQRSRWFQGFCSPSHTHTLVRSANWYLRSVLVGKKPTEKSKHILRIRFEYLVSSLSKWMFWKPTHLMYNKH